MASNEYINTINSVGFSPLINQPTRIFYYENTNHVCCSTLDHIITNSSQRFSRAGILISDVSDHFPVIGFMSITKPNRNTLLNSYRRCYTEKKKNNFLECLTEKLKSVDETNDINSVLDSILLCLKDANNEVFPLKKMSRKKALLTVNPWMTKEILKEQQKRDRLKSKWTKSGRHPNSPVHIAYKNSRNLVVTMIRSAKQKHLSDDCKKCNGDSKKNVEGYKESTE